MGTAAYHFVTRWRVRGTCEQVSGILENAEDLPRWWPSVYLSARVVEPGSGPHGLGRRVELLTKGYLPYRLRWRFTIVEQRYPHGFTIRADGDFVGTGEWTFVQHGDFVNVTYDWQISAEKPLLKFFTPVLRPLFQWNHRWAMAQGESSLKAELRRDLEKIRPSVRDDAK